MLSNDSRSNNSVVYNILIMCNFLYIASVTADRIIDVYSIIL